MKPNNILKVASAIFIFCIWLSAVPLLVVVTHFVMKFW